MKGAKYYKQNPFKYERSTSILTVYAPTPYYSGIIHHSLRPLARQILMVILERLQPDGTADLNSVVIAGELGSYPGYIRRGLSELTRYNLVQRYKQSKFWVNPEVARPVVVEN